MNFLDKAISIFSPVTALNRVRVRRLIDDIEGRRYEGAGTGRRHAGWATKDNQPVNTLIGKDLPYLVDRSRDLIRNDGNASAAPSKIANNIIGTGIIPTAGIKPVYVNGKKVEHKDTETILDAFKFYWGEWANNINCDFNRKLNFYGIQSLVAKTFITSGEVVILKKSVESDVNEIGIQLLVLEGDYIDKNKDEAKSGGYTVNGVLYDSKHMRLGYWLFEKHPQDGGEESVFVPDSDVIHLYDIERPGQNRGVPLAASTLLQQRDLNDYKDAELLGKKTQACLAGFITNVSPEPSEDPNDPIESIEPGTIRYLNQGEQVSFTSPPASGGFSEFVHVHQRDISNGFRMTYEMFTGDYSNVNFSSGRMGWIEFGRQVSHWQYLIFIPQFCDIVFNWFSERYKVLYASSIKDLYFKATWTAPRREMIDPVKETSAKIAALAGHLQSWRETVKQDGYNPDDVLKELEEDQKAFEKKGLTPEWNTALEQGLLNQYKEPDKNTGD